MQELMAVSEIVISERVDPPVPSQGQIEGQAKGTVDLTLLENRAGLTLVDPVPDAEPEAGALSEGETRPVREAPADPETPFGAGTLADGGTMSEIGTLAEAGSDVLPPELAWQERALCAQTDPEAFFPEKGGSTREAKRVCMSCEVRAECLDYALAKDERFGIWGGLSERERRRVKKQAV